LLVVVEKILGLNKTAKSFKERSEESVQKIIFKTKTVERKDFESTDLTTLNTGSELAELHFESDRKLRFGKNELALKALKEGYIDFKNNKVEIKSS